MNSCLHTALLKHNKPVPRYTSYPTVPNFSKKFALDKVSTWMENTAPGVPVSLYFHVPFCKKMCWYCGCNTKATEQYSPVKSYLAYLYREVAQVSQRQGKRLAVSHIHFGGGSPSYINPDDFIALVDHVRRHFDVTPNAEIAIELDPRETSEAKIAAYANAGVTRASLGVQDFNKTVQKAINRVQPFHMVYDAVETLRAYGIEAISFDLLYGLPYQTAETVSESASLAALMKPDRIALFGYAHVPWMKKHMRLIDEEKLPDASQRLKQFDAARKTLSDRGYLEIGLDHFVRSGDGLATAHRSGRLRRNFQGYTADSANTLIGFGPSAISSFAEGYCQNTPDLRTYVEHIKTGKPAALKGIELTDDDRLRRDIISRLMCYGAVNLSDITANYEGGKVNFDAELDRLTGLVKDGLVFVEGSKITINKNASQACRPAAAAFDIYLQPKQQRHAQVA